MLLTLFRGKRAMSFSRSLTLADSAWQARSYRALYASAVREARSYSVNGMPELSRDALCDSRRFCCDYVRLQWQLREARQEASRM
jgi:hypothetical protein